MSEISDVFDDVFNIDEDKSEKGAEMIVGFNAKDEQIKLIVAESGCEAHVRAQRKHQKALERTRGNKEQNRKVWAMIIAEGIMLSWKNLLDKKGKPIEPTLQNRIAALTGNERLMGEVTNFSADSSNFQRDAVEDDTEKN